VGRGRQPGEQGSALEVDENDLRGFTGEQSDDEIVAPVPSPSSLQTVREARAVLNPPPNGLKDLDAEWSSRPRRSGSRRD
jgi:hypothetical protein